MLPYRAFLLALLTLGSTTPVSPVEKLQKYRGKIVVLNFWASWCGPCRKEMPLLMALQREFEDQGVQFLGASTDRVDHREKAEQFLKKHGIGYPVWFGLTDKEMESLGLGSVIPATAIFDRNGERVFRLIGEVKKSALINRLEWLLGLRQGKPPKELLLPLGVSPKPYQRG